MEPRQIRNIVIAALVLALLLGSRTIAEFLIQYNWWREMGQVDTWVRMLSYQVVPGLVSSVVAWALLVWAYHRGMGFSGVSSASYRLYNRLIMAALLVVSVAFIGSSFDSRVLITYFGSLDSPAVASTWQDPVFGYDISFYFFDLPFYKQLLQFVFMSSLFAAFVFWASARGWQMFDRIRSFRAAGGSMEEFDPGPNPLLLEGATKTSFARVVGTIVLAAAAVNYYLGQFELLTNQYNFMTGMDVVDVNVVLPLRLVMVLALLAAIPLIWMKWFKQAAIGIAVAFALTTFVPRIYRIVAVTPNELEAESPYIAQHLAATVAAYGLDRGVERTLDAKLSDGIDVAQHGTLIDNIRLWDTGAFTDTISQIQALRPYYEFADIDIDRYTIDGKIKQVLLSPREIDVNRLQSDAQSWTNTDLVYTHGYGVVMSEVNRTTDDGLPVLLIQDAPPDIRTPDLRIDTPAIYYGEVTHDPVFVNTDQGEFDYPSGDENINSNYQGTGGFPISSLPLRLAAAISEGEINILLTGQINANSRMMLYRDVTERLQHLASFLQWDYDPYMVITDDGRLVWIVDGYTTSSSHPYSAAITLTDRTRLNYIRNSVKATVDAFNGETTLYVFDEADPIIQAYAAEFPALFADQSEMPSDLRAHVRYPLVMFDIQASLYRQFHMQDPAVFYNKEDVWAVARSLAGESGAAGAMTPTYIVATLPGEEEPEFILMLPFTPQGKDNLIGWMAARCDGDKLGELVFFQLSKQELVFGPNQIESRINQDEEIAKDLTLWNQQGSRVLRGDILALPVGDSFLYVESIYIQAETARMPQLRKVVLAQGNRLIYEDTFEQALFELGAGELPRLDAASQARRAEPGQSAPETQPQAGADPTIAERLSALRRQAETLARQLQEMERELGP